MTPLSLLCASIEVLLTLKDYIKTMKTIKCSQVGGGTCSFEVTAETAEESKMKFSEHAKEAHADMMAAATPESMKEWNEMFDKVWHDTPAA